MLWRVTFFQSSCLHFTFYLHVLVSYFSVWFIIQFRLYFPLHTTPTQVYIISSVQFQKPITSADAKWVQVVFDVIFLQFISFHAAFDSRLALLGGYKTLLITPPILHEDQDSRTISSFQFFLFLVDNSGQEECYNIKPWSTMISSNLPAGTHPSP